MKTEFTIEYFIDKFMNIPADQIGQGDINQCCALYHVNGSHPGNTGYFVTDESTALSNIFSEFFVAIPYGDDRAAIYYINDATSCDLWIDRDPINEYCSPFRTFLVRLLPKERIVFALSIAKHHRDNPDQDIKTVINKFISSPIK